jgi:polyisoprenoid-binding protein YceI
MPYTIDPVHSHVGFSVRHLMIATVRGRFTRYEGTANLDASDFTKSTFTGEIDATSIDTGNEQRDGHLKSPDFFDVAQFPKITFKSTSVAKLGDHFTVTGDLTMRGVTKSITLEVEYAGVVTNPRTGAKPAGFSARGELNRKDFGISFNVPMDGGFMVSETVKLALDFEAAQAS